MTIQTKAPGYPTEVSHPTEARAEQIRAWIWRYYDTALNKQDLSIVDEIAGSFEACANNLWTIKGSDDIKASIRRTFTAFTGATISIDTCMIEQDADTDIGVRCDRANIWWEISGVFENELMGIPPTYRRVTYGGTSLLYIHDFKLIAARAYSDIYQKLGQLPQTG